jgi:hypothetical protein
MLKTMPVPESEKGNDGGQSSGSRQDVETMIVLDSPFLRKLLECLSCSPALEETNEGSLGHWCRPPLRFGDFCRH